MPLLILMDYFTSSRGIAGNPQVAQLLKTDKIRLLSSFSSVKASSSKFIGWGYKPNTLKTRDRAKNSNVPYWALEDGFIGWLNHPSQSKPFQRLSYIIDRQAIYYDASKPSGLDHCLAEKNDLDQTRIDRLLQQLVKLKISKYNQVRSSNPDWIEQLTENKSNQLYLLVDQTFGDASIEFSGGGEHSFERMLDWALDTLAKNDQAQVIIKTHPDVILGRKKGYLYELFKAHLTGPFQSRIHILSDDVSPAQLLSKCQHVATVSSQLGFEALWQAKKVTCFAWPFYAGRGLTADNCEQPLSYERQTVSLQRLVHAALIQYPTYLNPDTNEVCEVEDIIDYLQAHFLTREMSVKSLCVPDVSLWKRSFIPEFISASTNKIQFTNARKTDDSELIWGMKSPDKSAWRIEDGFIRSVGLGADLRRPSSLVLDDLGIYYNGKQASRLERLLNEYDLNDYENNRAIKLVQLLIDSAITKYNVDVSSNIDWVKQQAGHKEIILVVGQFQQDLSMEFGAEEIRDNMALLRQARADYPEAYIIYKEHPDVYSGVRPGKLNQQDVLEFASAYVTDVSITDLFKVINRVCTICSLSGFEALLRGLKVTTYGLPFYAGWGLTDDRCKFPRRNKTLSLTDLTYIALVLYARYVSWDTRNITSAESVIYKLLQERTQTVALKSHWFFRQYRKIRYLGQALFGRSIRQFSRSR